MVGGGGSGIGAAVARGLASRGVDVVITGRSAGRLEAAAAEIGAAAAEIAAAGESAAEVGEGTAGRVVPLVCDLADPTSSAGLVQDAEALIGPLDVLVLNAGGPPPGRVLQVDDDGWRAGSELLLLGPLRVARAALPAMAARGHGRLVVITSSAVRQPQAGLAVSVVLRSAMTAAAKLLAAEHAADGVTVNCVAPGSTDTARFQAIVAARAASAGTSVEEVAAADAADVPAGRAAHPEEVAAAVVFLASPEASYINGTVLTVDGGRTETIW